jgi:Stage II sporulation protein
MMRTTLLELWRSISGRDSISLGALQAVSALLGAGSLDDARALLLELHGRPLTSTALETGNARAIVEALAWENAVGPAAEELVMLAAFDARQWGEPLRVMINDSTTEEPPPAKVLTVDGWLRFEEEYLPRVVTGENGHGPTEALKAQAIAARTYVLRAMRDHRALGRTVPIGNSQKFQVYAKSARKTSIAAVESTRGIVGRYQGRLIVANYVAGALWTNGAPGADATKTERFVTYNEGKRGRFVTPTKLADTRRPDNRGCMSQNGANWLATKGRKYPEILRYFYGADLELDKSNAVVEGGQPKPESDALPGVAIAATLASMFLR